MIAKWIRCHVPKEQMAGFAKAQRHWQECEQLDGFSSQLGGWNQTQLRMVQAHLFAQWQNLAGLQQFMASHHDSIAERSQQIRYYHQCDVACFKWLMALPSYSGNNETAKFNNEPGFMRIADCQLLPSRRQQFLTIQRSLWNPGMAAVNGMLGGACWQSLDNPNRVLVTSYWRTEKHHRQYQLDHLPQLLQQANVSGYLGGIAGYGVELEPSWQLNAVETTL